MTTDDPTPKTNGPRGTRDQAAERLHEEILDLEDLVSELEGCLAAATIIATVVVDRSLQTRTSSRALWYVTLRGEDLVERLQTWHVEALRLARAAAQERRP